MAYILLHVVCFMLMSSIVYNASLSSRINRRSFPIGAPRLVLKCNGIVIEDEFFRIEWYIKNYPPFPISMNIDSAWHRCYTGKGVIVGVVDGGVYQNNPDLQGQFIDGLRYDPVPEANEDRSHGTKIAGVIAARRSISSFTRSYGIGVAFDAKLADVRILSSRATEQQQADGLTWRNNYIDIYTCAFSHFSSGVKVHPMSTEIKTALVNGVKNGRQGKGSVFVWSTGNGGGGIAQDSCAYEGVNNSPYVIPVAGADYKLNKLSTGQRCSAILTTALSRNVGDTDSTLVTTEGPNGSTNDFARNSAAVAITSGVIALALQANPNLTYRDIMHLIVESSRNDSRLQFPHSDFETNGAGRRETFGFGILDAGLMVDLARNWRTVGGYNKTTQCIYKHENMRGLQSIANTIIHSGDCTDLRIEHVEVRLRLRLRYVGHYNIYLVSNTARSLILPSRPLDDSDDRDVTVLSVKFWGEEASRGAWRLQFDTPSDSYYHSNTADAFLQEWTLRIHGSWHGSHSLPHGFQPIHPYPLG